MNIHDVQVELLGEIDKICKDNHIQYVLYGECSRSVCMKNTLMGCGTAIEIAMCQGDAERFVHIVEELRPFERYVEGLVNNPRYPYKYLAYGNSNTTDFNIKRNNYIKNKGIQIRIHYIDKMAEKSKKQILLAKLRKVINSKISNRGLWYLRFPLGLINLFVKIIGEKRVGCWYYNSMKRQSYINTWDDIFEYSNVIIAGKTVSTMNFEKIENVSVDGLELPIPKDYSVYFEDIFGTGWDKKSFGKRQMKSGQIVSATVGFEKLLSDSEIEKRIKNARDSHESALAERAFAYFSIRKVKKLWNLVLMTKEQMEFRRKFQEQKEYILNLDNEKDQKELYHILNPVILSLVYYSEKNMTYSVGTELDNKIEMFMLSRGQGKKVKRIRKLRKVAKFV